MNSAFTSKYRFLIIAIIISLCFLSVLARLLYLHVWNQERFLRVIERNRQKFVFDQARRGNIVDSRGNILATTESRVELGVDPQMADVKDYPKWLELSEILNIGIEELEGKFTQKYKRSAGFVGSEIRLVRWARLAESIDLDTFEKIKSLKIKGVYGNKNYTRTYPSGCIASHILGYVNKDQFPIQGVETFMNFYLQGQNGWRESERDGLSRELAQFCVRQVPPIDGLHVELTVDSFIQHTIESELQSIATLYNPKSATIIVSEPSTGYILGLANYPTYDPGEYWKYDIDAHRNRAVSDVFEPGSPFKMVTASAVLEQSLVKLEDCFDCSQKLIKYKGRKLSLPNDHRMFYTLTFKEIMKKSSNRGIAQLAMLLGEEKLYEYAKAFGFGEATGYGPGSEVLGTLHKVSNWDSLTITRLPMGHAVNCTPLQMHCATSAIANQGVLMVPQVVKRVFDDRGNTVVGFSPKAKRRVISVETSDVISSLLEEVVGPEGTSRNAAIPGYNAAGKSGTTQLIIDGAYSREHHVASFSGFFPADKPRIVVTIVINDANIEQVAYGGRVAAPSFKNIGEHLIQYLNIQPYTTTNHMLVWKE